MINDPVMFHLHHMKDAEDLPFWQSLAERMGEPILELGCGTGRLLIPLTEGGHQVIGLDINFAALVYLNNSLRSTSLDQVQVFQSNIDQFHLKSKFSLIFLACNTLSTLSSVTRAHTFRRIHDHLHPDGVFAASFPNPVYLHELPDQSEVEIEETLIHPASGNPLQVSSNWQRSGTKISFYWHYDQLFPDGQVMRDTVETEHYLTSLDEYIAEMKSEKLQPIEIFGDYDHSRYDLSSPYAIIIARKEI